MADSSDSKVNPLRIVGFVILLLACIAFGFMASTVYGPDTENAPYWWTGKALDGSVTSMTEKELVIVDEGGKSQTFEVNSMTRVISFGGKPITPGQMVVVRYKEAGEKKIARGIRGIAPPNADTASPAPDASASPAVPDASPSP